MSEQKATSLEQSMLVLAESNLTLAKSLDNYAAVLDKYAVQVVNAATLVTPEVSGSAPAPTTKAATGRGAKAPKEEPKAAPPSDDGFGMEDAGSASTIPDKITAEQMKAKLMEVKDAYGDKGPALKIINNYGYAAIGDIKPADYKKIWGDCETAIENAPNG